MKEAIRERSFMNGQQTSEFIGKRTIYRNKNGKPFIRDWQGKKMLLIDPDGMLVLEHRAATVSAISVRCGPIE
jgi:hypothetical protein